MSQDTEKYLYFKVGLLKDSFALEALWQDALRYHMIDQPAKLIAMRLTEYYELTNKGPMQSRATIPTPTAATPTPATSAGFIDRENKEDIETPTSSTPAIRPPVTSSPVAYPPVVRPIAHPPATPALNTKPTSTTVDPAGVIHREGETSLAVSAEVDQNAEEAADYWSLL
jgi:hypothetical protein